MPPQRIQKDKRTPRTSEPPSIFGRAAAFPLPRRRERAPYPEPSGEAGSKVERVQEVHPKGPPSSGPGAPRTSLPRGYLYSGERGEERDTRRKPVPCRVGPPSRPRLAWPSGCIWGAFGGRVPDPGSSRALPPEFFLRCGARNSHPSPSKDPLLPAEFVGSKGRAGARAPQAAKQREGSP